MKTAIAAWVTFVRERFSPLSYLVLVGLFVAAHGAVAHIAWTPHFIALFGGLMAFFFKLRLFDEIKDFDVDRRLHPTRPLARGLLTQRDLYGGIGLCLGVELLLFGAMGLKALVAIGLAIAYSLLMFREFFVPCLLRPRLTLYAVTHTAVAALLSLAVLAALQDRLPWALNADAYRFALNAWCLFNVFEFGRKTFDVAEERAAVESYSSLFGRSGAALLALSMALCSVWITSRMATPAVAGLTWMAATATGLLAAAALIYLGHDRPPCGRLYRAFSSVYIALFYTGYIAVEWTTPAY